MVTPTDPNGSSSATPHVRRNMAWNSAANVLSGDKTINEERVTEAKEHVRDGLSRNVSEVLAAAAPLDSDMRKKAVSLAEAVCQQLEPFILHKGNVPPRTTKKRNRRGQQLPATSRESKGKAASDSASEAPGQGAVDYSLLLKWVNLKSSQDTGSSNSKTGHFREVKMYPWIGAFIKYVADQLVKAVADSPPPKTPRQLETFRKADVVAIDADDWRRVDMALTQCLDLPQRDDRSDELFTYAQSAALIEVKRYETEETAAFDQLALYTPGLYATQVNRRFAWGLTICGTHVRACLFIHDNILASEVMDVATEPGRKQFVTLLVNWAMCESQRLGYDPTIRYNRETSQWEIDVWDDESRVTRTYICEYVVADTSSLFGQHRRCFVARAKESSDEQPAQKVLIKDAWAYAAATGSKAARDELSNLRAIRDKLDADDALAGTYSHLEAGGIVQQKGKRRGTLNDTTELILANFMASVRDNVKKRVHWRVATTPVGEDLQKVRSVDELIVVVGDVMAAHTAIVRRCDILHRDLSTNKIMFCRDDDGMVRGLLIDFNNAVLQANPHDEQRPDRTGIYPYMSIGNLEQSSVKRTALDDWESLIYILCWLGTIGINRDDQTNVKIRSDLTICHWRDGSATNIAKAKRRTLQHSDLFGNEILACFAHPLLYANLARLILELRSQLFYNERLSSLAQGCIDFDPMYSSIRNAELRTHYLDCNIDTTVVDPFARRAEFADAIVDDLLNVIQEHRNNALNRIKDFQLSK
ncbi:hypothetical protein H4S01_000668 [Coemansia sp. RSA 2610]|nr:hypothetical protein IWW54_000534 [Coemansia sp. RSA 2705]KAJ2369980.1 hypothetical protein H4S01_000668 [Coemansia sp. RSA 2610]